VRGRADGIEDAIEVRGGLAPGTQVVRQFDARLPIGATVQIARPDTAASTAPLAVR
jgi:hypothetical protein